MSSTLVSLFIAQILTGAKFYLPAIPAPHMILTVPALSILQEFVEQSLNKC
jgi:hypothetical protein